MFHSAPRRCRDPRHALAGAGTPGDEIPGTHSPLWSVADAFTTLPLVLMTWFCLRHKYPSRESHEGSGEALPVLNLSRICRFTVELDLLVIYLCSCSAVPLCGTLWGLLATEEGSESKPIAMHANQWKFKDLHVSSRQARPMEPDDGHWRHWWGRGRSLTCRSCCA